MACSIAVKRPHDFEPYGAEATPTSSGPSAKKLRPCSFTPRFGGASLNINLDQMSLATPRSPPSSSSLGWKSYRQSAPIVTKELVKAPHLPPPPNVKRMRAPFEEATAKCKPRSPLFDRVCQEYSRMRKRKLLDSDESGASSSTARDVSSSPPSKEDEVTFIGSPKKENMSISLKQACLICERLLKQQEEKLCSEYEQALIEKLSEQYNAYVKFSQDQLQSNNIDHSESYIS